MNIFTKMRKSLLVAAAFLCASGAWAQDPDLTKYTLVKSFEAGISADLVKGEALSITAYDTGNKRQQVVSAVTAPAEIAGWIAFQGTNAADGKGWWNRSGKGLYSYNATRSAAIYGEDLGVGTLVVFTCSDNAANVMTLTNGDGEPDGTFTYQLSEDGKTYYCSITAEENAYVGFCGNKSKGYISKIEVYAPNNPVTVGTYQIKFQDKDGKELKDAITVDGLVGDAISLADTYKKNVTSGDVVYTYDSDDAEGKTIVADGATVITVTFREAVKSNYSVEAVDESGNLISVLGNYSAFEGEESVKAPYNAYVLSEGVLYNAGDTNKEYNKSVNLTQDNMKVQVTYKKTDIKDVVYYQEAEDIDGLTKVTTGNTSIRSSNSASAYAAEADVVLTNLAPGKYKITVVICDTKKEPSAEFSFIAGAKTVMTAKATAVNWSSSTSEEFILTANTDLSLVKGGSNMQTVDFVYIQKTGEVLTVTDGEAFTAEAGATYAAATYTRTVKPEYTYGTICLPFAPDAETCANYTFYTLSATGADALTFTEVETPEAYIPYLYSAKDKEATTHTFTGGETEVASDPESYTECGSWMFFGALSEEYIPVADMGQGMMYYAYKPTAEDGDVLVKATKSLEVKPYRAYFITYGIAEWGPDLLSTMRIVVRGAGDLGDGTTAIEEVITPDQIEGAAPAIYNLMGQPVAQPVKGQIYIINGKKVVY